MFSWVPLGILLLKIIDHCLCLHVPNSLHPREMSFCASCADDRLPISPNGKTEIREGQQESWKPSNKRNTETEAFRIIINKQNRKYIVSPKNGCLVGWNWLGGKKADILFWLRHFDKNGICVAVCSQQLLLRVGVVFYLLLKLRGGKVFIAVFMKTPRHLSYFNKIEMLLIGTIDYTRYITIHDIYLFENYNTYVCCVLCSNL